MFTHREITVCLFLIRVHPVNFVYPSYWAAMGVLHRSLAQHPLSTDNCHSLPFLELCSQTSPSVFNKFVRCNFCWESTNPKLNPLRQQSSGCQIQYAVKVTRVSEPRWSICCSSLRIKGSSWKAYPVALLFVIRCKWLQLLFMTVQVSPSTDASCVSEVLRRTSSESCTDVGCLFVAK